MRVPVCVQGGVGMEWEGVVYLLFRVRVAQCLDFIALQEGFISDFPVTIHTPVSIIL